MDLEEMDPVSIQEWRLARGSSRDAGGSEAFSCAAGKNAFVVGPSGTMSACIDLPLPAAKPLAIGFAAAWREVQRFVQTTPGAPECRSCDVQDYCGRCPAWSFTETGDVARAVSFLCEVARERHKRYAAKAVR